MSHNSGRLRRREEKAASKQSNVREFQGQGQILSIAPNTALFSLLGTTYEQQVAETKSVDGLDLARRPAW